MTLRKEENEKGGFITKRKEKYEAKIMVIMCVYGKKEGRRRGFVMR